ncbi:hypothetical protein GCM10022254_09550 [Actinomadura meridiana]|uniref:Uncharacterized protein n=1 Tax=Actinomadura meridiana TaxID=559626 RepID=A0ABP8BUD1_9ACTN
MEFLSARLAEDEAAATECGYVRRTWDGPYAMDDQCTREADHVGKHGPWRALKPAPPQTHRQMTEPERRRARAEVASKRRILDEHFGFLNPSGPTRACRRCSDRRADDDPLVHDDRWVRLEPAPCLTVRLLALPYAGHPEYRDGWRP